MKTVKLEYTTAGGDATSKSFNVLNTNNDDIKTFVLEFNLYTTNTVTAAYKRNDFEEVELDD